MRGITQLVRPLAGRSAEPAPRDRTARRCQATLLRMAIVPAPLSGSLLAPARRANSRPASIGLPFPVERPCGVRPRLEGVPPLPVPSFDGARCVLEPSQHPADNELVHRK